MGKYLYAKLNYQTIKLNMKYELKWTHSMEAVYHIKKSKPDGQMIISCDEQQKLQ